MIFGGLRLCADPEAPHEQVASHLQQRPAHMLDYIAKDSSGDPLGPHADCGWAEQCRTQLGTFPEPFVANCPPSLAPPIAARIEDLRTTAYGPNFRR
jgi:hypothetical protein